MKKTLIILLAVAILGGAGAYAKKHDSSNSIVTAMPSSASAVSTGSSSSGQTASSSASYKDGTYTGDKAETPYGTVQVAVVVNGSKITDVKFLEMPNDQEHSQEVTAMSKPLLKSSTLNKQSASGLDMISGATSTYYGYQESLQAALDQAKLT